jgi:hypothetical protein
METHSTSHVRPIGINASINHLPRHPPQRNSVPLLFLPGASNETNLNFDGPWESEIKMDIENSLDQSKAIIIKSRMGPNSSKFYGKISNKNLNFETEICGAADDIVQSTESIKRFQRKGVPDDSLLWPKNSEGVPTVFYSFKDCE